MVRNPPKGKLKPVLQIERGTATATTAPILQRKRNCNCYDCSRIANSKKLQSLRPLQYCKERYCRESSCNYCDPSSIAERGKLELRPLQYCREIRVRGPTTISLVSCMTPWIVKGPESHTRALTPLHASVYRRVCVGSNPPSQPAPRPPRLKGLRFACGVVSFQGFFFRVV